MGIIISLCLTILGVFIYSSLISENSEGTSQEKQIQITDRNIRKASGVRDGEGGNFGSDSVRNQDNEVKQLGKNNKTDSSAVPSQDILKGNISTAVRSFSDIVKEGRLSQQELIQEIKGLKEKGKEGITELLNIIEGSTSFFKLIAAGVLGEIYSDTHDPIVKTAIEKQVLPLIQEVLDTSYDLNLKRQAVYTLGELGLQSSTWM